MRNPGPKDKGMGKSPYIPFYPSDWLAGTRGLTAAETGVYITILAMIYEREAPLDMPRERLARLCGCTVTNFQKAVDALLDGGKLVLRDGGLWNIRAECELEMRSAKREDAKSSAKARWRKSQGNQGDSDATASKAHCGNDASQNQNQNQIDRGNKSPLSSMEGVRAAIELEMKKRAQEGAKP
jgi:uncharacterized protein YdaU (DUF1376 family)